MDVESYCKISKDGDGYRLSNYRGNVDLSLFWFVLSDSGRVNLCKVAHELGIDVKKLEAELEERDKEAGKQESGKVGEAHLEDTEEIDHLMRQKPKGKPKR